MKKFRVLRSTELAFILMRKHKKAYLANTGKLIATFMLAVIFVMFLVIRMLERVIKGTAIFNMENLLDVFQQYLGYFLYLVPFIFLSFILFNVYIKITEDLLDNKDVRYGEQFMHVLKRSHHIIGVLMIQVVLSLGIVLITSWLQIPTWISIVLIGILLSFFAFSNHFVIIKDDDMLTSIKSSFKVVWRNFIGYILSVALQSLCALVVLNLLLVLKFNLRIPFEIIIPVIIILFMMVMPFYMIYTTVLLKTAQR